jgi:hypothetical protein
MLAPGFTPVHESDRGAVSRASPLQIALHYPHPIRRTFPVPHTRKNGAKLRHLEAAIYLKYLILCFVTQ